jgi:hypothetical protein
MVQKVISRLRYRTKMITVVLEPLTENFTMRQLQSLYEAILNKKLGKRNFTKNINVLIIIVKLEE